MNAHPTRKLAFAAITIQLSILAGCAGTAQKTVKQESPTQESTESALADLSLANPQEFIQKNYVKTEHRIPMRDGVHLFTQVYAPRDHSKTYPILMIRSPYSCGPYGESSFPDSLGPHNDYLREGFIFVKQDVRGCFMSEGDFVNMRPHIDEKKSPNDIDESSDTYDTVDWLVKNVPNNNGRVGMHGISYPGFYAAAGLIDAHPALKAVSPQAPIADWFFDDFHHHGAFFLPHAFGFMSSFCKPRKGLTTEWQHGYDFETPDGYQFYLDLGPLKNINEKHAHDELACWNEMVEHPNYDEYWQAQNLLPHLHNAAPAVMTVGGWFDAEDLYGPLKIYRSIESKNENVFNVLVMGPWSHGGWSRTDGDQLGNVHFGSKNSEFYRHNIELPFFRHFLKDEGANPLPEAFVFETGGNDWHRFDHWPPANAQQKTLFADADGSLSWNNPTGDDAAFDEFVSDPAKPVPYTEEITTRMTRAFMTDDQRFATRRPDVLVYQTDVLEDDITIAGPILADLWVSTSGTDSDWIVKVIDVHPQDEDDTPVTTRTRPMGGYQMMVRGEVIRGRFRNSYSNPEPFTPNEPTNVKLELLDVLHTFKAGHRIMVQIQCTWFPMVDRNPQKFVQNIFLADESDFTRAVQRVFFSENHPTALHVNILEDWKK